MKKILKSGACGSVVIGVSPGTQRMLVQARHGSEKDVLKTFKLTFKNLSQQIMLDYLLGGAI